MINLQSILTEYFVSVRSNLDIDYDWDIPKTIPIPFVRGTDSCAQANMRLRRGLRNSWINEPARRYELANWYVGVWGGIRRNKIETIQAYCDSSEEQLASSTWKGVATWSKILAIRNPDKYAIYDARVGAALLALQLLQRTTIPILFSHVPSRNKAIGLRVGMGRGIRHGHFIFAAETLPIADCSQHTKGPGVQTGAKLAGDTCSALTTGPARFGLIQFIYGLFAEYGAKILESAGWSL
jgi:hypothetical protein